MHITPPSPAPISEHLGQFVIQSLKLFRRKYPLQKMNMLIKAVEIVLFNQFSSAFNALLFSSLFINHHPNKLISY